MTVHQRYEDGYRHLGQSWPVADCTCEYGEDRFGAAEPGETQDS